MINTVFGIAGMLSMDKPPCPECDEDFTEDRPIHRECLEKRYGGVIPDEIEQLIKEFELE